MTARTRISSGDPWQEPVDYSRAVRVGDRILVSGTTGTRPDGITPEGVEARTRQTLDTIEAALTQAGATTEDVVAIRNYVTNIDESEQISIALRVPFANARPAMTMVQVVRLIAPEQLIEIEIEAIIGSAD